MAEIYTHNCIKCSEKYNDSDPDAYYCSTCNEARKEIAKAVDMKIATTATRRVVKSDLQLFNEIAKARGGGSHVSINDLGIKL